jgi:hypothetical protein
MVPVQPVELANRAGTPVEVVIPVDGASDEARAVDTAVVRAEVVVMTVPTTVAFVDAPPESFGVCVDNLYQRLLNEFHVPVNRIASYIVYELFPAVIGSA